MKEARAFREMMAKRRTVRRFSTQKVETTVLEECVRTASTAPSGANRQPWFFAIVEDPEIKRKIRIEAEIVEKEFYEGRGGQEWLKDLEPFETNWEKAHLEDASALIVIFGKTHDFVDGEKKLCYYSKESVGIATGMLITALHRLGLSTLTHTPSPMKFLSKVLGRPENERPFLVLAVGYEHSDWVPPNITRKEFDEIAKVY